MNIFSYLTDIYFQPGAVSLTKDILQQHNISKPLILTDKLLVQLKYVEKLSIENPIIFDDTETNPSEDSAIKALGVYQENHCDGIVALGGGSPIDLAKCVAILVHHPQPIDQYAIINNGVQKITNDVPPIIAIPTTSGSGSEVGRAALLTFADERKLGFLSKKLLPVAAVLDPELTLSLPPFLTAATGMDAISHCVETFLSNKYNPIADALSLDGFERGIRNIKKVMSQPEDINARSEMMLCSLMGGLSFQKSLGAVHSLSHPLGGIKSKSLHHGMLNAIFLPAVMKYNLEATPDKSDKLASKMNLRSRKELPDAFYQLNKDLKLPTSLSEVGVSMEDLEPLYEKALNDHCSLTNPRLLNLEDIKKLFIESL